MKKYFLLLLLGACAVPQTDSNSVADSETVAKPASFDSSSFDNCAACHLADGAGVPGAFPPVRNRATAIAGLDGGREYLMAVVSSGIMGAMEVGGTQYFGIMPGNQGAIPAEDLAAALNYLVFEVLDDKSAAAGVAPFTATEVSAYQQASAGSSPSSVGQMRQQLLTQHGDAWPK